MESVSDYERVRQQNVERNRAFMQQLGLEQIQSNLQPNKAVSVIRVCCQAYQAGENAHVACNLCCGCMCRVWV